MFTNIFDSIKEVSLDGRPWRCKYSPHLLGNVFDMIQIAAPDWNDVVRLLAALQDPEDYRIHMAFSGGDNKPLLDAIQTITEYCKKLNLEHTLDEIERVRFKATLYSFATQQKNFDNPYPPEEFSRGMEIISDRFNDELKLRKFLTVEPLDVEYFRKPELFGQTVSASFPSSTIDIEEAGTCFALDRWTACVFHLMRALERPLALMAESLGITRLGENWGTIINEMEKAIRTLEQKEKTPTKGADLQFYSQAAIEFKYFKNAWRNYVMHASLSLSRDETRLVMEHVRAFMQSLAVKLSE